MEREIPAFIPKVILAVAAHPDDLEFGASGSVAKWVKDGADVHYLICTDASKGSSDTNISPVELIQMRRDEQRSAADILGVKSVTFLDYEDGVTEASAALKRDIAREIRRIKPDTVVTQDPKEIYNATVGYINHNDHRNVGLAAMDAVYPLARDHLSFPELLAEGFAPHNVVDLLFMSFSEATMVVDFSDTYDIKLKALAAHASQVNLEDVSGWLDSSSRMTGQPAGYERGEGFIRLNMFL
jgi:LmbE family N-acetylglucosaminyl deacetylase